MGGWVCVCWKLVGGLVGGLLAVDGWVCSLLKGGFSFR